MTRAIVGVSVALIALLPAAGFGQTSTGSIGGVVRDVTGGVLPGVTVEAASPALIEKVRTVTSDDQGRYQIVDLRPGTYTVTFTLEGFAPLRREDIQLTAGFAATVNGELKPGALAETIVVSGSSPVVDVQKVLQQNLLTREELDEIPAMKTTQGFASLTLGASLPLAQQDVGGSRGESVVGTGIHGVNANDATTHVDGTKVQMMFSTGSGQLRWYKVNQVMAQEVTLQTAGISAEGEKGGFVTNVVPREGGNRFSLYSSGNISGAALQSENLTDDLRSRGVLTQPRVEDIYDIGVGVGGPIVEDRIWFYTGHRWWATNERQASSYYNRLQGTLFYEADLSRPTVSENWAQDHMFASTGVAPAQDHVLRELPEQLHLPLFDLGGTAPGPRGGTGTAIPGLQSRTGLVDVHGHQPTARGRRLRVSRHQVASGAHPRNLAR